MISQLFGKQPKTNDYVELPDKIVLSDFAQMSNNHVYNNSDKPEYDSDQENDDGDDNDLARHLDAMHDAVVARLGAADDNDDDDDDDENDDEDEDFLGTLLFDNEKFKIYTTDRDFVNNIRMWACQRDLNPEHVLTLRESIVSRGYMIGTFKVIRNIQGETRCIDGQHRIEAMKQIMQRDSKFNCDIIVEVYDVEEFESEEATKLFVDANCVLNMIGLEPNAMIQRIIKELNREYPDVIIDVLEGKRCNRPRINKRTLVTKLRELVMNYDESVIIHSIKDLNNRMGMWNATVRNKKCGGTSRKILDAVKENGCYMGLMRDCTWVNELNLE